MGIRMKIGVIGYTGMIGTELIKRGYDEIACDVTDKEGLRMSLHGTNYDAIIYAAGITDIDVCEENLKLAMKVNAWGVSNLVGIYRGKIIYISTDHIFSGKKWLSDGYRENHPYSSINHYGWTKVGGEKMSLTRGKENSNTRIIRTSKLFDKHYIHKPLQSMKHEIPITMTNVLKRSFLHVQHFVDGLQFVLDNWEKIPIILNISGTDIMTHYMFYCAVARKFGIDPNLVKARNHYSEELAPRPIRAGLNVGLAKKLGVPLYSAFDGVKLL
jgi:dTDP-4-dehydrorhamnose reductase